MPVLIIGGGGEAANKSEPMPMKPKKGFQGIGSKYMDQESEDATAPTGSEDERKAQAGKLLLKAIKTEDSQLIAEAVTTLVECALRSDDDSGETDE